MTAQRLQQKDWSQHARTALSASATEAQLQQLPGWQLSTDPQPALEKSFRFANYYETMAFVNAVALIAHQQDHHPDLAVSYGRCTVRLNTHDVGGISDTDMDCARRIDALLTP